MTVCLFVSRIVQILLVGSSSKKKKNCESDLNLHLDKRFSHIFNITCLGGVMHSRKAFVLILLRQFLGTASQN